MDRVGYSVYLSIKELKNRHLNSMKKLSTMLMVCMLLLPMVMQAKPKNDSIAANDSTLGIHPWKQTKDLSSNFAHWSLTFDIGFDLIDGDFQEKGVTIIPRTKVRPTGGISLAYDFTPTWGLMGTYTYANYGLKEKGATDWTLYGHMHTLDLLLTYDLVDAWFPHRKTDIFSCYLLAGIGMAFYNSDLSTSGETIKPRTDEKYDMAGAIAMGVAFEFNISRPLALGVKGLYHVYTKDNLDGKIQGNSNDCQEYVAAYLRWKIEGKKKNHQRNFPSDEVFASQLEDNAKNKKKPQKDTVYMITKDTLVISHEYVAQEVQEVKLPDSRQYVYFGNDKSSLDDLALITIQQYAAKMQEDTSLCVELSGYCDNTGSESHNKKLSKRRAERVAEELNTIYGISKDRIVMSGRGVLTNVSNSYVPNRRVEMRTITRQECEQLKKEQEEAAKNEVVEAEPEEEVKEAEPAGKPAILTTVTTKKNATTLAKLARKYFNNTYCWVYIYAANKDKLSDPDYIPENIVLNIPNLSDDQKSITHEEAIQFVQELAKVSE